MRIPLLALSLCCLPLATATAAPARYALDPVHTRVLFSISHAGFSNALGTLSGATGTLVFDPDDWQAARVEVALPLHRLELGDARWNQATLAPRLLDAQRHPQARFVSTAVHPLGGNRARVDGELTLRGVTRPLTLEVTLNALKRHPLPPFRRTIGFSASGVIERSAFGIDAWPSMIGGQVRLQLEIEAVREGRADATDDTAAGPLDSTDAAAAAAAAEAAADDPATNTVPEEDR